MAELTLAQKKALAMASARLRLQGGAQPQPVKDMAWSDVPMEALRNTPKSAANFASSMVQPILHPIDTANSMLDLAAGGISRGIEAVAGDQSWLPENQATATADAVGQFYKDRYGSMEGFKQTLATDPIGVAADASTVLTGAGGLARGGLGAAANTTRALETAGRVTNPVMPIALAGRVGSKGIGGLAKPILGVTTGTSKGTIDEAYRAGKAGGEYKRAFTENMRGGQPQEAVIQEAKSAVGRIADKRRAQYQSDMANIGQTGATVDMGPVRQTLSGLIDESFSNGHQIASDETVAKLAKIASVVDEWSVDPAMHTALGADALKRRIDDLMPSFTEAGNAERVVTVMRDTVKQAIVDQVPEYANAMKAYENSKSAQREIERSLSLGKKNAADTTLRKLQSLTRNNANTNYGARLNSAKMLEEAGAKTLLPKLAGQALSSPMSRGLVGQAGGIGALAAALMNPAFLAAAPAFSPRLVGEAATAAGTLARRTAGAREAAPETALLLRLIGNALLAEQQSQQ